MSEDPKPKTPEETLDLMAAEDVAADPGPNSAAEPASPSAAAPSAPGPASPAPAASAGAPASAVPGASAAPAGDEKSHAAPTSAQPAPGQTPLPFEGPPPLYEGQDFTPALAAVKALHILKDPLHGLRRVHDPGGQPALEGVAWGSVSLALVALGGFITRRHAGDALLSLIGAGAFLAAGVGTSFLLRRFVQRLKSADWYDDLFLFGGSLLFLAVGSLLGSLLGGVFDSAPQGLLFGLGLGATVGGIATCALTLREGLTTVGRVGAASALRYAVVSLAVATIAGGALWFSPISLIG